VTDKVCINSYEDAPAQYMSGDWARCEECGKDIQFTNGYYGPSFPGHTVPPPPVLTSITDPADKTMPGTPKERLRETRIRNWRVLRYTLNPADPQYRQDEIDKALEIWKRTIKVHSLPFDSWIKKVAETGELYEGELA